MKRDREMKCRLQIIYETHAELDNKCWHQCGMRTMIYYQEILDNTTPHRQLATEKFPDHRMRYWLQHHQQQQQSN